MVRFHRFTVSAGVSGNSLAAVKKLAIPIYPNLREDQTLLDMKLALGFRDDGNQPAARERERTELLRYINLKLAVNGLPTAHAAGGNELVELASGLLTNFREKIRLLDDHRCPIDARIEAFLNGHFADLQLTEPLRVPGRAMVLDRHGLARELSLPADGDGVPERAAPLLSRSQRRAPQSAFGSPHHRRDVPHCRGRPSHSRRQAGRAEENVRRALPGCDEPRRATCFSCPSPPTRMTRRITG